jgi:hypothetical protein
VLPEAGWAGDPPTLGVRRGWVGDTVSGHATRGHQWWPLVERMSGGVLLSHAVSHAVPSALKGLASGFGMGPGVSPSLWPPKLYGVARGSEEIGAADRNSRTAQWTLTHANLCIG